jgi:hypothetical protein
MMQARVIQVVSRIGGFFLSLKLDELRGVTDESGTVALRAAQLRCALLWCLHVAGMCP